MFNDSVREAINNFNRISNVFSSFPNLLKCKTEMENLTGENTATLV